VPTTPGFLYELVKPTLVRARSGGGGHLGTQQRIPRRDIGM